MEALVQEIRTLNAKFNQLEKLLLAKEPTQKNYLTRKQLEEKLGISTRQTFYLAQKGVLKSYKFQGKIYFSESEVNTFIESGLVDVKG